MNYYELRKKAMTDINQMLLEGNSEDVIKYRVGLRYGLSEKFVEKVIALRERIDNQSDKKKKTKKVK